MTKRLTLSAIFFLVCAFTAPLQAESFLCRIFGVGCPDPTLVSFVPTYEQNVQVLSPFKPPSNVNEWYFATESTAIEVCKRLACLSVYVRPQCSMGGGPNSCTAVEREIVFPDFRRNAGLYASYWTRNPEDLYPGLALKMAKMQLAAERGSVSRAAKAKKRAAKAKKPTT